MINDNDPLILQVGYPTASYRSGVTHDQAHQRNLLYFSDPVTRKELKVFDLEGDLIQSTPLREALHALGSITGVAMHGLDTIIACDDQAIHFAWIDGSGKVVRTVDLTEQLIDQDGNKYEFGSSALGKFIMTDRIVLQNYWRENIHEQLEREYEEEIRHFYRQEGTAPHMAVIKEAYSAPKIHFGLAHYYDRLYPEPRVFTEAPHYACIGDSIFVYSIYSPIVHILNLDLQVVDSFEVVSKYGMSHIPLPPMDSVEIYNIQENVNVRLQTKALIFGVHRDPVTGSILVAVHHEVPENSPVGVRGTVRPWSFIIYDKDLQTIGESIHSGQKHLGHFVLATENGLFIKRRSTREDLEAGMIIFDRLMIEGHE